MTNYVKQCMLILFLMFSIQLSAQNAEVKLVEAATKSLVDAMLKSDVKTLDQLTSVQLSYGHSSGKLENKTEFLHTFQSGASVFEKIEIQNQTVDVLENTALVRHTLVADTNDPGKGPAHIKIGIFLVWVKSGNEWLLYGRQAIPLK